MPLLSVRLGWDSVFAMTSRVLHLGDGGGLDLSCGGAVSLRCPAGWGPRWLCECGGGDWRQWKQHGKLRSAAHHVTSGQKHHLGAWNPCIFQCTQTLDRLLHSSESQLLIREMGWLEGFVWDKMWYTVYGEYRTGGKNVAPVHKIIFMTTPTFAYM